ncbi:MAG TPA: hypothetical protein VJ597_01320 [Sphingomicrobium sp.]|nr:hypothetical protein [Sphingomicrobium sp.]
MMREFLSASVATALLIGPVSPALAQSYAFAPSQAPLGVTATVNLKVPLGVAPAKPKKTTYGLTLGYGQRLDSLTADGRIATREAKLADIRFADGFKLYRAQVMSFDLANLDKDRRLKLTGDGDDTLWIVGGLVAAGVVVCLLADCFDGDDDDDDDDDVSSD